MLNLSKIKQLTRQNGMTMTELSKELGISMQALCKMIRENTTKISTLEQIAQIFGVPITFFFEDDEAQQKKELTEKEQMELTILRERVQSLQIARDALQEQVTFLREQIRNITTNNERNDRH